MFYLHVCLCEGVRFPELELQTGVSCPRSLGRAASALNCGAISSAPNICIEDDITYVLETTLLTSSFVRCQKWVEQRI